MTKKLKLASLMAALVLSTGANAAAFWFDADAGGAAAPVRITQYIDYIGALDVANTYTGPTSFTFTQTGQGFMAGYDAVPNSFHSLSAATVDALTNVGFMLSGGGFGTLGNTISFNSGTVTFYSPFSSNQIAQFNITGGGAAIDAVGGLVGASALTGHLASVSAGYFFKDLGGVMGSDVAGLTDFGDTNLLVASDLLKGPTTNDPFGRPLTIHFGANGQAILAIPEPASIALIGLGLLGAGALRRRRQAS